MRLLILDNRDSFTYNLAESFRKIGVEDFQIWRSSDFDLEQLDHFDRIAIGPGPGLPADHPLVFTVLNNLNAHQSVLGICLGHEALALHFGGKINHLNRVFHGDSGTIHWTAFAGKLAQEVPDPFAAGLYHSWIVDEAALPSVLEVTAYSAEGLVMGIQHRDLPWYGFQFHPESFITKFGLQLLKNWYY